MDNGPVFFDPKGRRGVGLSSAVLLFTGFFGIVATVFIFSILAVAPFQPPKSSNANRLLPGVPAGVQKPYPSIARKRIELQAEIDRVRKSRKVAPIRSADHVVAAFYAPWEETSFSSFQKNVANLTHVMPDWLHISDDGGGLWMLDFDDPTDGAKHQQNLSVARIARRNGVSVMPILSNGIHGDFDPARAHLLMNSPALQQSLSVKVRDFLVTHGYQGINVDIESMKESDYALLPAFLRVLKKEFANDHLQISIDIEVPMEGRPIEKIASIVDFIVLMDYDEHSEESEPGPIASFDWANTQLDDALLRIPPEKLVLGIGSYAYDWNTQAKGQAEGLTFQEALANAKGYRDGEPPEKVVHFDDVSLNETFAYNDDNDQAHTVWILSALSAYNQWLTAQDQGIRGAAIWALGMEDPSIWTFIDRNKPPGTKMDPKKLLQVKFPDAIDYQGKGEMLKVFSKPQEGSRRIQTDKEGIIVAAKYKAYPLPYVVKQSGFRSAKDLVLTFDDGPDPEWTPQILRELKELNVPAAFFVIGKNAEGSPDLVRDIYDQGHEVGNHTFFHPNIGLVGQRRATLEIDATQRAIESITGRSTILFRPPYNADSQPETDVELAPVILATDLDYLIVGEKVDPEDWDLFVRLPNGSTRPKTANDIVQSTLQQIHDFAARKEEGNVILLHDAGGPRDQTVKALPTIVKTLEKEGYRFVSISDLLGKNRDYVMPPIPASERWSIFADRLFFTVVFRFLEALSVCFLAAIALGITRVVFMTPLALIHKRKIARFVADPNFRPRVSALIAAYNEEAVIVRTIQSVLDSHYEVDEVIVVNDGSKDRTAEVVIAAFSDNPKVRSVTQPNSGKATALNNAIALSHGEILFCIDADTQLDPYAINLLVRHFSDEKVGAVAGNVRVGNVTNLVTLWQSIEYTTSQNVDRRAYALLNAVTVVPGAIGAWRKSAVETAGGYVPDTLAEDMDLTWRLRTAGFRQETEPGAIAYTEAPDSFKAFFGQRFRWTYGTLQCLWKHRDSVFRYGWFGRLALPTLWLFQIFFQVIAPLVDLQILVSLLVFIFNKQLFPGDALETSGATAALSNLEQVGFLYALFFGIEFGAAVIAYRMDRQRLGGLWWLFLQRFVYRQILYLVAWKAFVRAIKGTRQGWGKLERKGTVNLPK
jgi:cellulose synthase/poly-beta-1,6-N-acetylglucosamine synthase-like glycosyltransferase/spore germination protein YaaH/peptidoglycan/xylan/chitin deacetylase (PgdA/CDA1 family)